MSERDKWGRIPVKLIEVDQEFCALRWGELPCQAGPQSNYQLYSGLFGDSVLWTTTGTVNDGGVPAAIGDTAYDNNDSISLDQANAVSVASAKIATLPVITEYPDRVYLSFVYEVNGGVSQLLASLAFKQANSASATISSANINCTTGSVNSSGAEVNDVTITSTSDPDWNRVKFWVDPAVVVADADNAFSVFADFFVSSASSATEVGLPQVSFDSLTEYRQTEDEPKIADAQPCFNTLSSCQSLDTYSVSGRTEGFLPAASIDSAVYSSTFQGNRNEGLYVEFYLCHRIVGSGDLRDTLLDIDGILTVDAETATGVNDKLIFVAGGQEIEYELGTTGFESYKLAAYYSRSGTLTVREVEGSVSGASFSSVPTEITISNGNAIDGFPFDYALSDLIVYDYQPYPLNLGLNRQRAVQKGDLNGDALFYAKFGTVNKMTSESGIVPTGNLSDDGFVVEDAIADNVEGRVNLDGFGFVDLLEPPLTLRFSQRNKSTQLPETLSTIPSLIDASNKPAELQVGGTNENISALGSRDELNVQWEDHPYSDIQTDPYVDQRTYDPESQGTFWGKWLARNVYKQGFPVRYVSGYELPDGGLERTHVYNYILDKVDGPTNTGKVTAKAFDILQSLRADRAVFPAANTGRLSADISDTATSLTLEPDGIGDEEYPSSGTFRVIIGGEGFDVTRSGDVLTFDGTGGTQRGLYSGAESHDFEDLVQIVAQFDSEKIHDIAYTIITESIPELAGNIPKDKWDGLANDFLIRLYSGEITEPTGVEDLLGELVDTAPIYFYADVRTNLIELGVIREPSSVSIPLREGQELIAGSVDLKEYPKERIDEVWVYYRIRNAAGDIGEAENYSRRFILVNPEEQERRGRRSIRRIYTRWLEGAGSRDTAQEIAQAYISRFQNQPIRVSFDLDARQGDIWLGDVTRLISRQKQTVTGEKRDDLNYQVIRAQESTAGHKFTYIAQSYEFFSPVDPDDIRVTISDENTVVDFPEDLTVTQINMRELYDSAVAIEASNITFVVEGGPSNSGGAVVGAGGSQTWSLRNPNDWPWSPIIELRIEPGAVIAGRGGDGGDGMRVAFSSGSGGSIIAQAQDGADGQTGFLCEYATTVNNLGIIAGGAGGGGGAGGNANANTDGGAGGGGAGKISGEAGLTGQTSGDSNRPGQNGTVLTGGAGGGVPGSDLFDGGRGGDLGQAGAPGDTVNGGSFPGGPGGSGGLPGNAIDGVSFVTYITRGDIRGNEV